MLKPKQAVSLLVRRSANNLHRVWNDRDTMEGVMRDPDGRRELLLKWPKALERLAATPATFLKLSLSQLELLRDRLDQVLPMVAALALSDPAMAAFAGLTGEPLIHSVVRTARAHGVAVSRDGELLGVANASGTSLYDLLRGLYPDMPLAAPRAPGIATTPSPAAERARGHALPPSTPALQAQVAGILTRYEVLAALTAPQQALLRREFAAVLPTVAQHILADERLARYDGLTGMPLVHELVDRHEPIAGYILTYMPALLAVPDRTGRTLKQFIATRYAPRPSPPENVDLRPATPTPAEDATEASSTVPAPAVSSAVRICALLEEAEAPTDARSTDFAAPALTATPVRVTR
jgi:hypothetical protein